MAEPTEEQTKEFWEWCGLELLRASDNDYHWFNVTSDGDYNIVSPIDSDMGLPVIDLNNLFKWAVPKLRETYNDLKVVFTYTSVANCSIYHYGKLYARKKNFEWLRLGSCTDKDPALALFWALDKVRRSLNETD